MISAELFRLALALQPPHSALAPASRSGELVSELGIVLFAGAALIFVLVLALALYALLSPPRQVDWSRWVIGGGLVFPIVTLAALLIYSLNVTNALSSLDTGKATEIEVIAKRWWWEIRYVGEPGKPVVVANELHIPVGRPVHIALLTDDLIHSFWVPSLAGKVDMIPGRTNRLVLEAQRPGIYRGQCAEYCGAQHAWMAFLVVAQTEEEFRQWLAQQASPAIEPSDAFLRRGRNTFMQDVCVGCHTIRGTPASGRAGPDLTHVGSRRTLAAGTLDNHVGTMAGWIADNQTIKPGNLMPSFNKFSGEQLRALASYLLSLE